MEGIYEFLIKLDTMYFLNFWTVIFFVTLLMTFFMYKIFKYIKGNEIARIENVSTSSTVTPDKETAKPKFDINKEKSILEKPQPNIYTNTFVTNDWVINEPKPVSSKTTETKQEMAIPKVETITVKSKQTSKEQLPKAKIETAKPKGETVFVNYDISKDQTINSYPVFRFPRKGTVVRSFRFGSTKRRGFKEESFQKSIEQYFGKDFTVSGNTRLNTGKETRPFEPDIAIRLTRH